MRSNTFCDILNGQLIWAYFILLIVAQILLVMVMQDIYLIHTKLDLKQAMCLYVDCHILEIYKAVHRDTSSNHAEIIAIHEATRECVWLRSMIHLI